MENKNASRRNFLADSSKMVIAAGLATVIGAGIKLSAQDKTALGKSTLLLRVDMNDPSNAALKTNGGAVYVQNPSDKDRPIIVYRKADNEVTAFSSKCTHKGGPLDLPGSDGLAVCKWHKAAFDTNGDVKKGPAKDHLTVFKATLADGAIMIEV